MASSCLFEWKKRLIIQLCKKTMIIALVTNDVPEIQITQLSGHKKLHSLNLKYCGIIVSPRAVANYWKTG